MPHKGTVSIPEIRMKNLPVRHLCCGHFLLCLMQCSQQSGHGTKSRDLLPSAKAWLLPALPGGAKPEGVPSILGLFHLCFNYRTCHKPKWPFPQSTRGALRMQTASLKLRWLSWISLYCGTVLAVLDGEHTPGLHTIKTRSIVTSFPRRMVARSDKEILYARFTLNSRQATHNPSHKRAKQPLGSAYTKEKCGGRGEGSRRKSLVSQARGRECEPQHSCKKLGGRVIQM